MKKFTLFVAAAALATSVFAQAPQKFSRQNIDLSSARQTLRHTSVPMQNLQHKATNTMAVAQASHRAPSETPDVIYAAEGETKTYSRQGIAWQSSMFGLNLGYQDGMAAQVVYDADGKTVYFKDIICFSANDTYVKGTISEDGTKITVPMGQFVFYDESYQYGCKLAMLNWDDNEQYYITDESTTEAVFTVDGDKLKLLDTDEEFNEYSVNYPTRIFGLVYDDIDPEYDGEWAGFGDMQTVYSPVEINEVEVPEDLEVSDWLLSYDYDSDGARDGSIVKVGMTDTEIFIQGLNTYDPEKWIKGTIEGDQVRIANGQYLGLAYNMLIFLIHAESALMYDEYYDEWYMGYEMVEGDFVMNYDAATKTLTTAVKDEALVVNAGLDQVYYVYVYLNPTLAPFNEVAGVPQDPEIYNFDDMVAEQGLGLMECHIPLFDVNGNFMNPEKLAYKIYIKIDGEIEEYVIYPDEYEEIFEEMIEIPYSFTDDWDIMPGASEFYFYQTGFDLMGIQTINYNGGQRNVSHIVWYDGSYDDDPTAVGIQQLSDNAKAEVIDLMGRKSAGQQGFVIVRKGNETRKAMMR